MNKNIYFVTSLIKRFREDELAVLSSRLAYSLLLSFMPFMIFLLTIVGFTPINGGEVISYLSSMMPKEAFNLVKGAISEVVLVKSPNLLSFSLIAAIWSASAGIKAMMWVLNKAYGEKEHRGFFKVQFIAVFFTIGIVAVLFSAIVLLVLGNVLGEYLKCCFSLSPVFLDAWDMLRYILMVFIMIFIFAAIYRYVPSRRLTWLEVFPGSLFSSAGWIISSFTFSFYVDNYANYSKIYGSLAAIFILLLWIYLGSMILLIGGEINATLAIDFKKKL